MKETIGFIGLGIMGSGMARNLLKAGFDVHVWNRTASRMAPLVSAGARGASDAAGVAAESDIIVICVSETQDVEEVLFGESGVIKGARPGITRHRYQYHKSSGHNQHGGTASCSRAADVGCPHQWGE